MYFSSTLYCLPLDLISFQGASPLLLAVDEGHVSTVKVLLSGGANPNRGTDLSGTALHQAAQEGEQEIVDVLLSHGAKIDATTSSEGALPSL